MEGRITVSGKNCNPFLMQSENIRQIQMTFTRAFCRMALKVTRLTLSICGLIAIIVLIIQWLEVWPWADGQVGTTDNRNFITTIQTFPWDDLISAIGSNNTTTYSTLAGQLLLDLTPFLTTPPKIAINHTCTPPTLQFPPLAPRCRRLGKPRRVGVIMQLGFDTDTLEIHMRELDAVVDYFFILESTRSHYIGIRKPLVWDILQRQQRFAPFLHKVVHFVLDDDEMSPYFHSAHKSKSLNLSVATRFGVEFHQEKMRWKKFLHWNDIHKHFNDSDILGFGDADEIPSRNVIHYFANCQLPSDPIDVGIWFPYGRVSQIYKTDWPVASHPFSYGDPTYWTLRAAKAAGMTKPSKKEFGYPTRKRGKSRRYLLGGMHMTHSAFLPFQITEYFTASSADLTKIVHQLGPLMKHLTADTFQDIEQELGTVPAPYRKNIKSLAAFKLIYPLEYKAIVKLPWFYRCNRNRYPGWEGKHDNRLD